ncbi:hypothetical protein [Burkholderia pyrrocinia]
MDIVALSVALGNVATRKGNQLETDANALGSSSNGATGNQFKLQGKAGDFSSFLNTASNIVSTIAAGLQAVARNVKT